MIYYLYGNDDYRRTRMLREKILPPFTEKYTDALTERFYLDEKDALSQFEAFVSGTSLFSDKKLATVYLGETMTKEAGKALSVLADVEDVVVVISARKKLAKKTGAFLYKDNVKSWEVKTPEGDAFLSFIKQEAEARDVDLKPSEIRAMASVFEGDTWAVITELEKLSLGGSFQESKEQVVFFDEIKRMRHGRSVGERLRALALLTDGGDAAMLFNMYARFAGNELRSFVADLDVGIKSGKLEYEEALLYLTV